MPRHVYHLDLDEDKIQGAQIALLPGDPGRVPGIAKTQPFQNGCEIANKREYRSWLAHLGGIPVLVMSTGIGGSSTSIAVDELAQLGVRTFLRVSKTGAIQPHIAVGDVVVTTGAVRLDGASLHDAPVEYPAVVHYEVVQALVQAAQTEGIPIHTGSICSTDTSYPAQERRDSYSGYVPRRFQGATEEWRRLQAPNYEMEAATLLTICSALGLRGGCTEGVVVNRMAEEHITKADLELGENNAVLVAVGAALRLVQNHLASASDVRNRANE